MVAETTESLISAISAAKFAELTKPPSTAPKMFCATCQTCGGDRVWGSGADLGAISAIYLGTCTESCDIGGTISAASRRFISAPASSPATSAALSRRDLGDLSRHLHRGCPPTRPVGGRALLTRASVAIAYMYIHRVTAVGELCFIIATYIGMRNDRLDERFSPRAHRLRCAVEAPLFINLLEDVVAVPVSLCAAADLPNQL